MDGLAPIDGWAVVAILAKATGYAAALLAVGGPLFLATFRRAPPEVSALARNVAIVAALAAVTVLAMRFGIRAARISGMGVAGATDAMMLGFVWDSPLGTAALWRGTGCLLVLGLLIRGKAGLRAGLAGAVLIAVSFAQIGHSLGDPRWLLAGLLVCHMLAVAFWVGSLLPLYRAAGDSRNAGLLHRFGVIAGGVVALLLVAGGAFAWQVVGSLTGLFTTAYGLTLLAKLAVVAGLLGLAGLNRLHLVPALMTGAPSAGVALRRAIRFEVVAVALILIATATLTSVTTPPVNL